MAHYLRVSGRKYGFLSTHEQTIFLKREYSGDRDEWILYVSNVFRHENKSMDPRTGEVLFFLNDVPANPSELTDKISTRLAMLTLAWLTHEDGSKWLHPRPNPDEEDLTWVIPERVLDRGGKANPKR